MEIKPETSHFTFIKTQSKLTNQSSNLANEIQMFNFKEATHFKNTHYNIGVALIFNYINMANDPQNRFTRSGTECDSERIDRILKLYGFDVKHYSDLTKEQTVNALKKVASEDHSNNDCLLVVIMSHLENDIVSAFDKPMLIKNFWIPFLNENCKTLINKPKIFLIQGCNGIKIKFNTSLSTSVNKPLKQPRPFGTFQIPDAIDFFLLYSTFEGYIIFENKKSGSWFIQTVCEVLEEYYENNDEIDLNYFGTIVNSRIAQEFYCKSQEIDLKEMPNVFSTLTKSFILKQKAIP